MIGCPVGNKGRECCRGCGGWYKAYTRDVMLRLLHAGKLNEHLMPCGTLKEQARRLGRDGKGKRDSGAAG